MTRIGTLPAIVVTLLLGSCASTTGTCAKNSICPIVIYERFPGYFATHPEHMEVTTGGGPHTLVWTFAESKKYKFSASTEYIKGDGVELIDANGSVIGMTSCFITKRSRPDFVPATEGPYYRCEIVPNKDFVATRYRIRFRTNDGSPRFVDPTVSSTGGGDSDLPPTYTDVSVRAGDDVLLPPKAAGIDGIRVIWNSETGALFRRSETPMVLKVTATGNEVDIQPCTPSTSPDGRTAAPAGQYYACIFSTPDKPLALTYNAKYTDSANNSQTRNGNVTRAP